MSRYGSLIALPLWIVAGLLGLNLMVALQPGAEAVLPEGPIGACCIPGANDCIPDVSEVQCLFGFGGVYQGDGTTCGGAFCGACCLPDESCLGFIAPDVCAALGGAHEADTACAAVSCDIAACCLADASCSTLRETDCTAAGGIWHGPDGVCGDFDQNGTDDVCETSSCPHDVDNDGTVGIVDFLDLLGSWGACP